MINATRYSQIMNEYDEKRRRRDYLIAERRRELYKRCPEFESLEQELTGLRGSRARAMVCGNQKTVKECDLEIEKIENKIVEILSGLDIDEAYLNPPYECPDCQDTGMIENTRCHCLKQKLINVLYEQSYMKNPDDTFDTLDYDMQVMSEDRQRYIKVVEKCLDFCNNFGKTELKNLYISGSVGVGKTKLCNCIANDLLQRGKSCIYLTTLKLADIFVSVARKEDGGEELRRRLFDCDLLILDDLGTENPTDFFLKEFYGLINERIVNHRPFVISSNLENKDLIRLYGERTGSRILAESNICRITGEDVRYIVKDRRKQAIIDSRRKRSIKEE